MYAKHVTKPSNGRSAAAMQLRDIQLDEIILENHLPRLIAFKFASCATSFGTVDMSTLPPV